jgi:cysteine desulfurase/selenocysteine lyase
MSTSDPLPEASQIVSSIERSGSLSAAVAGLPDPALLARWANEMFRAGSEAARSTAPTDFPGISTVEPVAVMSSGARAAASASSLGTTTLSEEQLHSIPSTLTAAGAPTAREQLSVPEIPSALPGVHIAAEPAYSFLQEARGLVWPASSAAIPVAPPHLAIPPAAIPPLPKTPAIPFEAALRDLTQFASAAPSLNPLHSVPAASNALADPMVAGAPRPATDWQQVHSIGFLDLINPLEPTSASAITPIVPAELRQPSLSDLAPGIFDVAAIRRDFPILRERVNGRPLIWLDNAATTQKPRAVIDRISWFYEHENSNIHRAAHALAASATDAYESAREKVRRFLHAPSARDIIFVRGATEAINLVAQSWGRRYIQKDDEIVITWLEHHANIVPWQMLCAEKGAKLRVAPVDDRGQVILEEYEKLLGPRTRLVSFAHVSNALGTITPAHEMIAAAHRHGAKVLLDGAQSVSHLPVDVQSLDCDFFVFSGHKVFAPTGIGVVFGKENALDATPPWQGGGNMITDVTFEKTQYQTPPGRFEAGTGSIADAVGLGAAIDYVERIGMANISRYEHDLLLYATDALQRIPGLHLIGTAAEKASVLSFVLDGFRTEDVGAALNLEGIAVRSGHHCAQPILRRFGVEATVRPSLALYNTCEDIDALVAAIWNLKRGRAPGPL